MFFDRSIHQSHVPSELLMSAEPDHQHSSASLGLFTDLLCQMNTIQKLLNGPPATYVYKAAPDTRAVVNGTTCAWCVAERGNLS